MATIDFAPGVRPVLTAVENVFVAVLNCVVYNLYVVPELYKTAKYFPSGEHRRLNNVPPGPVPAVKVAP